MRHRLIRQVLFGHRKVAAGALGVSLTVFLAAGCASSTSASSGTGSSTGDSSSTSGKLTGSPIVLGSIGSYSGPAAAEEGSANATIEAWAAYVNAHGGINGHPVKLYVKDDGSNPTAGLQAAQQLVQQDHVIAIVGEQSNVDVSWASYIESTGVPVVGGNPLDLPFSTNPDFFASGASAFTMVYGIMAAAKANGGKLAVLYCAETPQCASGVGLDQAISKAVGVKIVYISKVSATATSYAAPCLGAKGAGATSIFIADGAAVAKQIADACLQQGVKLTQLTGDGAVSSTFLSDPAFEGTNVTELNLPFFNTSAPAGQQYRAVLKQYAPGIAGTSLDDPNASYSWAAGLLFQAAAKAIGLGANATSAEVKKGLYMLSNETLGGFSPPLTFTPGKPDLVNCYFTFGINGGKYSLPDGTKTSCAPMSVLEQIVAPLSKLSPSNPSRPQ